MQNVSNYTPKWTFMSDDPGSIWTVAEYKRVRDEQLNEIIKNVKKIKRVDQVPNDSIVATSDLEACPSAFLDRLKAAGIIDNIRLEGDKITFNIADNWNGALAFCGDLTSFKNPGSAKEPLLGNEILIELFEEFFDKLVEHNKEIIGANAAPLPNQQNIAKAEEAKFAAVPGNHEFLFFFGGQDLDALLGKLKDKKVSSQQAFQVKVRALRILAKIQKYYFEQVRRNKWDINDLDYGDRQCTLKNGRFARDGKAMENLDGYIECLEKYITDCETLLKKIEDQNECKKICEEVKETNQRCAEKGGYEWWISQHQGNLRVLNWSQSALHAKLMLYNQGLRVRLMHSPTFGAPGSFNDNNWGKTAWSYCGNYNRLRPYVGYNLNYCLLNHDGITRKYFETSDGLHPDLSFFSGNQYFTLWGHVGCNSETDPIWFVDTYSCCVDFKSSDPTIYYITTEGKLKWYSTKDKKLIYFSYDDHNKTEIKLCNSSLAKNNNVNDNQRPLDESLFNDGLVEAGNPYFITYVNNKLPPQGNLNTNYQKWHNARFQNNNNNVDNNVNNLIQINRNDQNNRNNQNNNYNNNIMLYNRNQNYGNNQNNFNINNNNFNNNNNGFGNNMNQNYGNNNGNNGYPNQNNYGNGNFNNNNGFGNNMNRNILNINKNRAHIRQLNNQLNNGDEAMCNLFKIGANNNNNNRTFYRQFSSNNPLNNNGNFNNMIQNNGGNNQNNYNINNQYQNNGGNNQNNYNINNNGFNNNNNQDPDFWYQEYLRSLEDNKNLQKDRAHIINNNNNNHNLQHKRNNWLGNNIANNNNNNNMNWDNLNGNQHHLANTHIIQIQPKINSQPNNAANNKAKGKNVKNNNNNNFSQHNNKDIDQQFREDINSHNNGHVNNNILNLNNKFPKDNNKGRGRVNEERVLMCNDDNCKDYEYEKLVKELKYKIGREILDIESIRDKNTLQIENGRVVNEAASEVERQKESESLSWKLAPEFFGNDSTLFERELTAKKRNQINNIRTAVDNTETSQEIQNDIIVIKGNEIRDPLSLLKKLKYSGIIKKVEEFRGNNDNNLSIEFNDDWKGTIVFTGNLLLNDIPKAVNGFASDSKEYKDNLKKRIAAIGKNEIIVELFEKLLEQLKERNEKQKDNKSTPKAAIVAGPKDFLCYGNADDLKVFRGDSDAIVKVKQNVWIGACGGDNRQYFFALRALKTKIRSLKVIAEMQQHYIKQVQEEKVDITDSDFQKDYIDNGWNKKIENYIIRCNNMLEEISRVEGQGDAGAWLLNINYLYNALKNSEDKLTQILEELGKSGKGLSGYYLSELGNDHNILLNRLIVNQQGKKRITNNFAFTCKHDNNVEPSKDVIDELCIPTVSGDKCDDKDCKDYTHFGCGGQDNSNLLHTIDGKNYTQIYDMNTNEKTAGKQLTELTEKRKQLRKQKALQQCIRTYFKPDIRITDDGIRQFAKQEGFNLDDEEDKKLYDQIVKEEIKKYNDSLKISAEEDKWVQIAERAGFNTHNQDDLNRYNNIVDLFTEQGKPMQLPEGYKNFWEPLIKVIINGDDEAAAVLIRRHPANNIDNANWYNNDTIIIALQCFNIVNSDEQRGNPIRKYSWGEKFWSLGQTTARRRRINQLWKIMDECYTRNMDKLRKQQFKRAVELKRQGNEAVGDRDKMDPIYLKHLVSIAGIHSRWPCGCCGRGSVEVRP